MGNRGLMPILVVSFAIGGVLYAFFGLHSTNTRAPTSSASSGLGTVPVSDPSLNLKESGTNYFPDKFQMAPKRLVQDRFDGNAPYRVLSVEFINAEQTNGTALISDHDGNIFLSAHPRVIRFEPDTYFTFPSDKFGKRTNEPQEIGKHIIDTYTNKYLKYLLDESGP